MSAQCIVYAPYSFSGQGPAQSCASIVAHFPAELSTELYIARFRTRLPDNVRGHEALPPLVRKLPWNAVRGRAGDAVNKAFTAAFRSHDPASTVVYLWPGAPVSLVRAARQHGFPVVREMINTACATSGPILDAAYEALGRPPTHNVTREKIEDENRELHECDFFFASNPEVEASLLRLGVDRDQVLSTTFGWSPERFRHSKPAPRMSHGVRALFVGSIGVRKGVPELLDAWRDANVAGELVLAGRLDPAIADLVEEHVNAGRVRLTGHVDDIGALYLSADIFVFPTLEEGGPQVTYEAAGCGLPLITTPMGAARLVETGRSGIVVPPRDRVKLTEALRALGTDLELRSRYGASAREAAATFDYRHVGLTRGQYLAEIACGWRSARRPLTQKPAD